jgi:hypothetical protein
VRECVSHGGQIKSLEKARRTPNAQSFVIANPKITVKTLLTLPDAYASLIRYGNGTENATHKKRLVVLNPLTLTQYGRCDRIRTYDPLHPMQVRYQAAPHTEEINCSSRDVALTHFYLAVKSETNLNTVNNLCP